MGWAPHVMAGKGSAWRGMSRQGRFHAAEHTPGAMQGEARQGSARGGWARTGKARTLSRGKRLDDASAVPYDETQISGEERKGAASQCLARPGGAGSGLARTLTAAYGMHQERQGEARRASARRGRAQQDGAGTLTAANGLWGEARYGKARLCRAGHSWTWRGKDAETR